jgi:hypothetical protein
MRKHPRFALFLVAPLALVAAYAAAPPLTGEAAGSAGPSMAAENGPEIFRSRFNGDGARVFWSVRGETNIRGSLFVGLFRDGTETEATLIYNITECDRFFFNCRTVQAGSGLIPPTDVHGSGNARLVVETNTSAAANPDFRRIRGSGGVIRVEFSATNVQESRFAGGGTSVFKFLDFSSRFNSGLTYTETSATAGGTVIGFAVPSNTFARMTEEHQATVVITKN